MTADNTSTGGDPHSWVCQNPLLAKRQNLFIRRSSDDLTAIRGMGIATQNRLYRAGIKSYGQLARATPEDVRKILGKLAGGATVGDWIAQAKQLAKKGNPERLNT